MFKHILLNYFPNIKENATHYILPSLANPNKLKLYIDKKTGLAMDFISGKGYNFIQLLRELDSDNYYTYFNHVLIDKKKERLLRIDVKDCNIYDIENGFVSDIKEYLKSRLGENYKNYSYIKAYKDIFISGVYFDLGETYVIRVVNNFSSLDINKFYNKPGYNVKNMLFCPNKVNDYDYVVIVEGLFDALSGINFFCAFGNFLTKEQTEQIKQYNKIIFFIDNDDAGKSGLIRSLKHFNEEEKRKIFYFISDQFKDANDMLKYFNYDIVKVTENVYNSRKCLLSLDSIKHLNLPKNIFTNLM